MSTRKMHGFLPRNLKYMRRFAEVWPNETIVQRSVAQLSWRNNICLMEKVSEPYRRLYYENSLEVNISKPVFTLS
ncbi:MAG: hypothetical protein IJ604_12490 [Prevotella sp.]|nr:hypothetical protein [Prevotella sp.]